MIGKLIVQGIPTDDPTNAYIWQTANIPPGTYYVYAKYHTDSHITYHYGVTPIVIAHNTTCLNFSERPNLVPNPGFEAGQAQPKKMVFLMYPILFLSDQENMPGQTNQNRLITGKRAIKLAKTFNGVNATQAKDTLYIRSTTIDLPTLDGKYLLTAWLKTDNVATGQVIIRVDYHNQTGDLKITGHKRDVFYSGNAQTSNWTQIAFLINPPHWDSPPYPYPARAKKISISFSLDHSPGTVWIDNVSLVHISDAEYEHFSPINRYEAPILLTTTTPITFPKIEGWNFTVQQDSKTGVWWLVKPDQSGFFGLLVLVVIMKNYYLLRVWMKPPINDKYNIGLRRIYILIRTGVTRLVPVMGHNKTLLPGSIFPHRPKSLMLQIIGS